MREFKDIASFLTYMRRMPAKLADANLHGLEKGVAIIAAEARTVIGEYQAGVEGFVGWAELADSTKDDRVRKGFSENEPGLRTGEMRDSIESAATFGAGVVGSQSEKLEWFDQGTERMPPRSVLGIAAVHKTDAAVDAAAGAVAAALAGLSGAFPK